MNTHTIYRLVFPNGKVYIGQTAQKFEDRMNQHKYGSFTKSRNYNILICRAIRKYNWVDIIQEVLYTIPEEFVDEAERYSIKFYKSNNPEFGYNSESGGSKNKHHSEKSKEKISKNNARYWKNKNLSEDTKQKLRESQGHSINAYTKIGEFIKTFNSITQASKELKIPKGNICYVLKNKRKSAGGYDWRYAIS